MSVTMLSSQTPAAVGTDGSPGITTGTTQRFGVPGSIVGVRFWSDGGSGTYTVQGWQVTASDAGAGGAGTSLFDPIAFVGTPVNGWNEVAVSPIAVTPDTVLYRAGVHHPTDYALTNNFFASSGLTNNDITADQNGSNPVGLGELGQGTFTIDASISYPRQVGASALYFVEFLFEPEGAGGGTIEPGGVAVSIALGAPLISQTQVADAGALAIPVALGAPSLSQVQTVDAGALAIPVALGAPSLAQTQTVDAGALAVPIALGAPSISQTITPEFEISPGGIAVPIALGSISLSQTIPEPESTGGWGALLGIVNEARADHARAQERKANPIECPTHGWPLETSPRGERHCSFGGHVV